MGQSNTHAGIGLDLSTDTASFNVFQLGRLGDRDMEIVPAIEPLDHHTKTGNKIGFSLTVANLFSEYVNDSLIKILIIPCGYGGTGFLDNSWNKGDILYEDV